MLYKVDNLIGRIFHNFELAIVSSLPGAMASPENSSLQEQLYFPLKISHLRHTQCISRGHKSYKHWSATTSVDRPHFHQHKAFHLNINRYLLEIGEWIRGEGDERRQIAHLYQRDVTDWEILSLYLMFYLGYQWSNQTCRA